MKTALPTRSATRKSVTFKLHELIIIAVAILIIAVEVKMDFLGANSLKELSVWQWIWGALAGSQMLVTKLIRVPIAPGKWYDFTYVPLWLLVFTLPPAAAFFYLLLFSLLIYILFPNHFFCKKTWTAYTFHFSYQILLFFMTIQSFWLVVNYVSWSVVGISLTYTAAMFASMFGLMFTDTLVGGWIQKLDGQRKAWNEWRSDYIRITLIQTLLSTIAMLLAVMNNTAHYFQLATAFVFFLLAVYVMYKASFKQNDYMGLLLSMISIVEIKDTYTKNHSESVGHYSVVLGQMLGLPASQLERLYLTSQMHDIGKIGIPDPILKKEGPLTNEEYEIMKTHAGLGEKILSPIHSLRQEAWIIGRHHEHLDGTGYPNKLMGKDIPLEARIISIADAYHAMISHRPYRRGLGVQEAVNRLEQSKGAQFDPELVDLFCQYVHAPGRHTFRFRPFCLVH